jgi:hypothetical protein
MNSIKHQRRRHLGFGVYSYLVHARKAPCVKNLTEQYKLHNKSFCRFWPQRTYVVFLCLIFLGCYENFAFYTIFIQLCASKML